MIDIQISDLGPDCGQIEGRLESETSEDKSALIVQVPQPGSNIAVFAQSVSKRCVGYGRDDGIGIRIAVSAYVDGVHMNLQKHRSSVCIQIVTQER